MGKLKVINPKTGEEIKSIDVTDVSKIKEIVASIKSAQEKWAELPVKRRTKLFKNLQKIMLSKQNEIVSCVALDVGKNEYEALIGEFSTSFGLLAYYTKNAIKWLKPKRIRPRVLKHIKVIKRYEPKGVVAIITPWNYPLYLSISAIVAALYTGNGIIFKPSEHSPLVGEMIYNLFMEAGFPKELFQIVYGAGEVGKEIIDADIHHVCFTGSVATGMKINQAISQRFITSNMELGGKDAMVVLNDAKIERVVNGAIWGTFFSGGQICSSIERIYVQKDIYHDFISRLKIRLNEMSLNDPWKEIAPINNKAQFDLITKQIKEAEKKSKEIISNVNFDDSKGPYQIAPTFIIEPDEKASIVIKETFGPVAVIYPFETDEEVIKKVNDSEFGLTASVWSKNTKRAKHIMDHLIVGQVYMNDHLSPQGIAEAAWGGFKNSGFGKSRGEEGFYGLTNLKIETFNRLNLNEDIYWFPYSDFKFKLFKKFPKLIYWMYKF